MLSLFLAAPAFAATLTVDAAGGGDYTNIQAAINAASSGDRVEVAPGAYAGPLDFSGRSVAIVGTGGAVATTLTAGGSGYAVYASSGEGFGASLEGFTIANPGRSAIYVEGSSPVFRDLVLEGLGSAAAYGGAVQVASGAPAFDGVTFRDNAATQGAHVYVGDATPSFTDCAFEGGQSDYGAVFVYTGEASFTTSAFTGNIAALGGGAIAAFQFAAVTLEDTDFTDNRTGGHGGAVQVLTASSLTATGGTFRENFTEDYTVYYGGGLFVDGTSGAGLDGVRFEQNYAAYGGAIHSDGGDVSLTGAAFSENWSNSAGGALNAWGGAVITDESSDWSENYSYYNGGALTLTGGAAVSLSGSTFDANQSYYGYGGALYAQEATVSATGVTFSESSAYYSGGGVYLYYMPGVSRFEGCTFSENTTTYGNGAGLYGYYYADMAVADSTFERNVSGYAGGGIYTEYYTSLDIEDSTFEGNLAGEVGGSGAGGAVYFLPYNGQQDALRIRGSVFEDNTALGEGGAVLSWYADVVEILDSRFVNNEASPDLGGGALMLKITDALTVRGNLMANNRSAYGGAAYAEGAYDGLSSHRWSNNILQENRARYGGGACFVDMGNPNFLDFHNNDLLGNVASDGGGGLCLYDAAVDFRNNVVAYQVEGAAVSAFDDASASGSTFAYNDLYENIDGDTEGVRPADMADGLDASPRFSAYTRDGDPDNDQLTLAPSSALNDAGDPAILDPDGSPSDVGATGGPDADTADADGDGYSARVDCDDDDRFANPGVAEVWYDGVNQDCEPGSDYDADGDGHDSDAHGGDDCDDEAPDTWEDCGTGTADDTGGPDTTDDTGDPTGGTDTTDPDEPDDTGGADSPEDRPPLDDEGADAKGCGCAAGPSAPGGAFMGLVLIVGVLCRRRVG